MRVNFEDEDDQEDEDKKRSFSRRKLKKGKKRKHSCLRMLIGWVIALLVIVLVVYGTIHFMLGPLIESVNEVPNDFPKELALYQLESAKIKIQSPESRAKVLGLIQALPDWVLKPIWGYLSDYITENLLTSIDGAANLPDGFSIEDFKTFLNSEGADNAQTVWFSWDVLDKTKEEIASMYKNQLSTDGFEFQENLGDYKIDIGFWKDNFFGIMSFEDLVGSDQCSAEVMVNYLDEAQNYNPFSE